MSQESFDDEIVVSQAITIDEIAEYSTRKVFGGPDDGKLAMKRNLECMKNLSDEEISKIFKANGNLRTLNSNRRNRYRWHCRNRTYRWLTDKNPAARTDMVKSTRKHAIFALKMFFEEETQQNTDFKMPNKLEIRQLANKMISEENIRHKFNNSWKLTQMSTHRGCTLLSFKNN